MLTKEDGPLRAIVPLSFGFAVLAALLIVIFAFIARQTDEYRDLQQVTEVTQRLAKIFSKLQDAETGQRGFLLTGDPAYLAPFEAAAVSIQGDFKALSGLVDGRFADQSELSALRGLADEKLRELNTTIDLYRNGNADQALALVKAGTGKSIMDQIRAASERLNADLHSRRVDQLSFTEKLGQALRFGSILAFVLAAAMALFATNRLRRSLTELTASHEQVRNSHELLFAETQQREALADQLRQSQKMEAVGQLTGGLAHDLNNMLAVVIGSLNLAKRRLLRGEAEVGKYMENALDGAERAATLTHRLLAFARQQPLSPVAIDPNKLVAGMSEFLRRTLSESVRFESVLAGGLWRAHADPGQLENALLNLAINARDAMPEGVGKLTIETSNAFLDESYVARHVGIQAGQYVLISVTDTGVGMTPEIIDKVFDPFFTTKPSGQGTGLGLSQVYGFVKQSSGHIKIYSEPGHGTSVKIYLPRFTGVEENGFSSQSVSPDALSAMPTGRASEVVLVAEDDERVREMTVDALKDLGYSVLQADGAAQALRHIDEGGVIDLLFTDIVMPDVNGRKLADEAGRRRPGLRVLYTTGFTRNAVVHHGTLDQGVDLISKPFSIDQLARKVREILDR